MPLKYALPLIFIGALVLVSTAGCTVQTQTTNQAANQANITSYPQPGQHSRLVVAMASCNDNLVPREGETHSWKLLAAWAGEASIQVVKAPGQGYIQDYSWASKRLGLQGPVLIIAADLPLIDYRLIDRIIERHAKAESSALGVYLPYEFCDEAEVPPDLIFAADANLESYH